MSRERLVTLTGMIGAGKSALAKSLAGRADRDLVVLDGCERSVAEAAAYATELLSAGRRVLVTSRRPLRLPGEVVVPVRPLGDAAADLFVRRAPGLDRDDQLVAEICAELDGVPAAVEQAADGLRDGDLTDVLRRVGSYGSDLARAAFADCSAREVAVCAELARLPGPFSVRDAEDVCEAPVADVLETLCEQSILSAVDGGRYVLPRIFQRFLRSMPRSRASRRSPAVLRTALLAELESSPARVRLLSGPAGSGKSVVLRQLAARSGHPVVRCAGSLVAPLAAALGLPANTGLPGVLDSLSLGGTLYLDDTHTLAGRPDAAALSRLVEQAPRVRFVVATRDARVFSAAGDVHRVGYDRLRMGPDEVAALFATVYRTPLPARDAAALCARADGLAAALRLAHLDTVSLAPDDRVAALRDPLRHSDRLREFLVRDVLGAVPEPMREVMVELSLFGVLDPDLCDAHLGRVGSARLLAELAARQALTFREPDGSYRFHPLMQQLLDDLHLQRRGPRLTRQGHHGVARRLAAAGHRAAAHRAYARAGDWQSAATVRPATVADDDPWVLLAEARRLRGDGRFAEACDRYLAAERGMTDRRQRWTCELERTRLTHWLAGRPGSAPDDDVSEHLVAAVRGAPAALVAMALPSDSPEWTLGRAVAAVLDGRPALATELAESIAGRADPFVSLAARLLTAVVRACRHGQGSVAAFGNLADDADDAGWPWLARIARAATAVLSADACDAAAATVTACDERGDDWGALIAAHLRTIGLTRAGRPSARESRADARARAARLGARLPEEWLDPVVATEPRPRLVLAERLAPPAEVRCLGPFTLTVADQPVDLGGLRPQARRLLRLLSMQYGRPMHEERLVAALWPDVSLDRAKHRLHVAVSSVRTLLRARGGVARQGSTYLLALPDGSVVDVVAFETALGRWRTGKDGRDLDQVRELGADVLEWYRGELLVEEGTAEWVLTRREAVRADAVGVAAELGRLELDRGDVSRAVEVCARGLTVDERDYRLWTLLAEARRREGNPGAARRARQLYRELVAEG